MTNEYAPTPKLAAMRPSDHAEREAFESHYAKIWKERTSKRESLEELRAVLVTMRDDKGYNNGAGEYPAFINNLWEGWQAHAATPVQEMAQAGLGVPGQRVASDEAVTDEQIIAHCKSAGINWIAPDLENDPPSEGGFPGSFDMVTMAEMRKLLASRLQVAGLLPSSEGVVPTFSCHLARDHGDVPCASDCGKLRCMYPSAPSAAPGPELVTVGAMHKCRTDARFDRCVNCGAMAEELARPCKAFMAEAEAARKALASREEAPAPRYGFLCYSCSHEWEANAPTADCPAEGCGTTNNFNVDHRPAPRQEAPVASGETIEPQPHHPGRWIDKQNPGWSFPSEEAAFAARGDEASNTARLAWLHTSNKDSEGYEYGVCKAKFDPAGKLESFLWTASDSSDVDAAMSAAGVAK